MFLKFIAALVLTFLLVYTAYLFSSVIPWWGFAIGAFASGVSVPQKLWLSWLSGFVALFLCWGVLTFIVSSSNNHLLAAKMATVLPLSGSPILIILVTALVAAIIGGFASLAGASLRKR